MGIILRISLCTYFYFMSDVFVIILVNWLRQDYLLPWFSAGSDTVVEVICGAFERLSELNQEVLDFVSDLILDEISDCIRDDCFLHLSRLLSLLYSVQSKKRGRSCGKRCNCFNDLAAFSSCILSGMLQFSEIDFKSPYGVNDSKTRSMLQISS